MIKALEITKGDHAARAELARSVTSPLNEKNLGENPPTAEKVNYYQELYTRGWEKFTYRELPKEEKLEIARAVSQEADGLLQKARLRAQQRAIERLEKEKKKDAH